MVQFIGNCNHLIDWDGVIDDIRDSEPGYIGPRHDAGHTVQGVDEVCVPIRNAGYKMKCEGGSASWGMYFPKQHFDISVVKSFIDFVGMDSYINCWVSRVMPGDVAPWHWDITDDEFTLNSTVKEIHRYHCHIDIPRPGHFLSVEDKCFYNEDQGNVYKWSSRMSWHSGANAGLTPKYLFNIWG
jgi:hypothetical protein